MPNVGGKKFPYTAQGMRQASKYSKATGTPMVKNYKSGGVVKNKGNIDGIALKGKTKPKYY